MKISKHFKTYYQNYLTHAKQKFVCFKVTLSGKQQLVRLIFKHCITTRELVFLQPQKYSMLNKSEECRGIPYMPSGVYTYMNILYTQEPIIRRREATLALSSDRRLDFSFVYVQIIQPYRN